MSDISGAKPPSSDPLADLRGDAQAAKASIRDRAGDVAGNVKSTVASAADEAVTQGENILGAAGERAEGLAEEGKQAVAEQASGLAKAVRHAADDLEGTSPEIARHVRTAADSVEGISAALRDRSAGQLIHDVTDFARRQPAAFFGVAALTGFALARFAKSSADGVQATSGHAAAAASPNQTPHQAPGWVPAQGTGVTRPATMAAASLGGAVAHRAGDATPGSMPVSETSGAALVDAAAAPGSIGGSTGGSTLGTADRKGTPL